MADRIDSIRKLGPLFAELRRRRQSSQPAEDEIRIETIEAVLPNNRFLILGAEVPATGTIPLRAGQRVPVIFQQGRPTVIPMWSARRAQFPVTLPPTAGQIVEMLFIAQTSTGKIEVFFRNDQQVTNLNVRDSLPADPDFVKWGSAGDRFVVRTSTLHSSFGVEVGHAVKYHVFRLVRPSASSPLPSRDGKKVLGSTVVTSEFEVTVDPFAGTIQLVTIDFVGSLTGTSHSTILTFIPGVPNQFAHDADTPISQSRSQSLSLPIVLDARIVDGQGGFGGTNFKSAHIDDVYLDDDGHVIVLLQVDLDRAQQRQHNVSNNGPALGLTTDFSIWRRSGTADAFVIVQDNEGEGVHRGAEKTLSTFNYPSSGSHTFLVDLTTGEVLFRSCTNPIVKTITCQRKVFRGGKSVGDGSIVGSFIGEQGSLIGSELVNGIFRGGTHVPPSVNDPAATRFSNLRINGVGTPVPADAVIAALGDMGVHGHLVRSLVVRNPLLTFLEENFMGVPVETVFVIETWDGQSGDAANGTGTYTVTYTVTHREIPQATLPLLSGLYVPRHRVSATEHPKGVLFLKVIKQDAAAAQISSVGVFALDLETSIVHQVLPFVAGVHGGATLGNDTANVGVNNKVFPYIDLLAANLHRVYFRWRQGVVADAVRDDVVLVDIDRDLTKTVLSTSTPTASIPAQSIIDLLKHYLTLTRPDFMYWPFDGVPKGNKFVRAWNRTSGALLLDATAVVFPPEDKTLTQKALNALKTLTSGLVPRLQSHIRDEDQIKEVIPGPSIRTVEDRAVLEAAGLAKPEE